MDGLMRQCLPRAVVHCAGFGLASTTNLPAYEDLTRKVNIEGTRTVVESCLRTSVSSFVLTSTVNVAFSGQQIVNGTEESHGWLTDNESHCDAYSKTKQEAEKIVFWANGKLNALGEQLQTCTLRLGGVYGPGDLTILGRSLRIIQHPITSQFFVNREGILMDYVHIDNVIQAHIKAVQMLEQSCNSVNGESFFITDGCPTDINFFLDPLYSMFAQDQSKTFPKNQISTPFIFIYIFSLFFALMSHIFGKCFKLPYWAFTPMETYKLTTSHYFSIKKAQTLLNYQPKIPGDEDWKSIKSSLRHLVINTEDEPSKYQTCFASSPLSRNFAILLLPMWKRI